MFGWTTKIGRLVESMAADRSGATSIEYALIAIIVGVAGGAIMPTSLTPLGLASAVGSGALYYAGAYWFYLGALRRVPASYAAVSFYLIPIVGVTAGALLLGERLDARQWVGAVIVLGAVLAILRQPSAAAQITGAVNLPLFLLEGVAILAEVFVLLIVLLNGRP